MKCSRKHHAVSVLHVICTLPFDSTDSLSLRQRARVGNPNLSLQADSVKRNANRMFFNSFVPFTLLMPLCCSCVHCFLVTLWSLLAVESETVFGSSGATVSGSYFQLPVLLCKMLKNTFMKSF
jgi:hypothetical protein